MNWRVGENLFLVNLKNEDGSWNLSEAHLAELHGLSARDGTLPAVFFDGTVRTAREFLRFAASPDIRFYAGYTGSAGGLEPAGFLWLDGFSGQSAYVHFCLFSRLWGPEAIGLAREVLRALLAAKAPSGRRYFRCLRAAVPETNRLVRNFMLRVGFIVLGTVPHGAYVAREGRAVGLVEAYVT